MNVCTLHLYTIFLKFCHLHYACTLQLYVYMYTAFVCIFVHYVYMHTLKCTYVHYNYMYTGNVCVRTNAEGNTEDTSSQYKYEYTYICMYIGILNAYWQHTCAIEHRGTHPRRTEPVYM